MPPHVRAYPGSASSYYHAEAEWDYPLDAFDRELLAADTYEEVDVSSQNQMSQSSFLPTGDPGENRRRADCNHVVQPPAVRESHQAGYIAYEPYSYGSSSPAQDPASSPTVLALQKKRKHGSQDWARLEQKAGDLRHFTQGYQPQPRPAACNSSDLETIPPRASIAPPVIRGIPLVPTYELPDHIRSVFPFEVFNAVQSKCFAAAFRTNDNIVVSAPTGSGKTVIMELALCKLVHEQRGQDYKIVYQAPTKSLCSERCRDWTAKFQTHGLKCAELTGDVDGAHLKIVQSADVIITTPEKWDSVTRKWRDNSKLMEMVKLFLVDEVHILRETRGATLEAIVSRTKSIGTPVRFIALSATVPNAEDVATWLGLNSTNYHLPAHCEIFDESFRPVQLEKHVVGIQCSGNGFAIDHLMTKEVPNIIARFSRGKPVLVFCVTKAATFKTAAAIAESRLSKKQNFNASTGARQDIAFHNAELSKFFSVGVAFHHSGLDVADRQAIESCFLRGTIDVICCTSTLAVGVNLPCYLVIVKGTSSWTVDGLQECSSLDIMQMLGRAGRPQFEKAACAVILTQPDKVARYQKMMSGQEILESSLHQNLIEHLNAEVGLGTVCDVQSGNRWLASSFLNVRLRKNPQHYQLLHAASHSNDGEILRQLCERDLKLLESARLIEGENGLRCTPYGQAMARYYVKYETMLVFLKLSSNPKLSDIVRPNTRTRLRRFALANRLQLNVLSQAEEFSNLKVRHYEKSMYKEINHSNEIRYPVKIDPTSASHKVSMIIQVHLGGVALDQSHAKHSAQLRIDTSTVLSHCNRLIRCLIDMQVHRGDANAVKNALELCRSLAAGVWDGTPMQLRQIETVGEVTARKLVSAGINNIETLLATDSGRIELILGKSQPFGSNLLKKAALIPNLHISVKKIDAKKRTNKGAEIRLRCEIGYLNNLLPSYFHRKPVFICFLCETSGGKLVDFRRFSTKRLEKREDISLTARLDEHCSSIGCHVVCDEIVGTHRYAELELHLHESWFPKKKSVCDEKAVNEMPIESGNSLEIEDFDDLSLADAELLAAESGNDIVEVIEGDIEQIMAAESQIQKPTINAKRKASQVLSNNTSLPTAVSEFREPKRLKNGNWTCQHTCNEMGKTCKHQCCREGVKKPKKRGRTSGSTSKGNNLIKGAFALSPTNAERDLNRTVVDVDDISMDSVNTSVQPSKVGSKGPKKPLGGNENPKRQYVQQAKTTSRAVNDEHIDSDTLTGLDSAPQKSARNGTPGEHLDSDLGDGDTTESEVSWMSKDPDFANCDWNTNSATLDFDDMLSDDLDLTGINDQTSISKPQRNANTYGTRPETESQNLFVSPTKTNESTQDRQLSSADSTGWLDDLEFTETVSSADNTRPADGTKTTDQAALTSTCPVTSAPRLTPSPNESATLVVDPSKTDPGTSTTRPPETSSERERRQHEETQRQHWAELPSWMYEEFGGCIDLV